MLEKIKEMGFHGIIYSIGSIAQSAASFILFPFYTKYLTISDFGAFSLIDLYGFLIGSIFYLGITSSLPRSYFDYVEEEKRNAVFSTGFMILIVGFIMQMGFSVMFSERLSYLIFNSGEYSKHLIYISLSSGFNFLNFYFFSMLRLKRKSMAISLISLFSLVSTLSLTIYFLDQMNLGIWSPIISRCITFGIILFLLILSLRKQFTTKIMWKEAKILLNYGVGMIFVNMANISIDWADRFFINKYLDLSQVGIYSMAYKFGSVISLVFITPFEQIWNPMMMEYRDQKDISGFFTNVVKIYFVLGIFLCLCIAVGILSIAPIIIQSDSYLPALKYAPFVSVGLLLYGAVNITNAGLVYNRKVKDIAQVFFLISIINLILNYYLIREYFVWGAIVSTLLSYLLVPLMTYSKSKKFFEINFELKKVVPGFIFTFLILVVLVNNFSYSGYMKSVVGSFVLLVISFLILFVFYTDKEVRIILKSKVIEKLKI